MAIDTEEHLIQGSICFLVAFILGFILATAFYLALEKSECGPVAQETTATMLVSHEGINE